MIAIYTYIGTSDPYYVNKKRYTLTVYRTLFKRIKINDTKGYYNDTIMISRRKYRTWADFEREWSQG